MLPLREITGPIYVKIFNIGQDYGNTFKKSTFMLNISQLH